MPRRIQHYAMIGDLHTAALVGRDESIDWLACPRFDSPGMLRRTPGRRTGRAVGPGTRRRPPGHPPPAPRRHRDPGSEWDTDTGTVRIEDFTPPRGEAADVVRIVQGLSGHVEMRMRLVVRFDYGRVVPWARRHGHDR